MLELFSNGLSYHSSINDYTYIFNIILFIIYFIYKLSTITLPIHLPVNYKLVP